MSNAYFIHLHSAVPDMRWNVRIKRSTSNFLRAFVMIFYFNAISSMSICKLKKGTTRKEHEWWKENWLAETKCLCFSVFINYSIATTANDSGGKWTDDDRTIQPRSPNVVTIWIYYSLLTLHLAYPNMMLVATEA